MKKIGTVLLPVLTVAIGAQAYAMSLHQEHEMTDDPNVLILSEEYMEETEPATQEMSSSDQHVKAHTPMQEKIHEAQDNISEAKEMPHQKIAHAKENMHKHLNKNMPMTPELVIDESVLEE